MRIIKINETEDFYNQIINLLQIGGVIAIPTDTVYGIAVDGSKKRNIEKLNSIKKRGEKPYTLFTNKKSIADYARITKKRIIDYFLPGPLTIILSKRRKISLPFLEDKIGIRTPQVDFIIKLLNLYNRPLAVTSANISGLDELSSPNEIAQQLPDIDLIIDGGKCSGPASTVLDLTTTPPTLLRKGKIPILQIEKVYRRIIRIESPIKFNVLFVCTGNTCRSPMAQGILQALVNEEYCEARSAGIISMGGLPVATNTIKIVKGYGGKVVPNKTKRLTKDLIEWADLILVMEFKHYEAVLEISPDAVVKTFFLKEYKRRVRYNEISDPIGKDLNFYHKTAQEMFPALKLIARDIERRFPL